MEVKSGYQQTEVGVIPTDWVLKPIASIATTIASGTSSVDSEFGTFPVYGSTGTIGRSSKSDYAGRAILIARVGANAGTLNVVDGEYGVTDNTIILRIGDSVLWSYVWRQLDAKRLNSLVFGSGQPLITGTQIRNLLIPFPPTKDEQEAIAVVLSDADALIESLGQLLAKKRQLKQGAMQELLTGKKRLPGFSGEWQVRGLAEVCVKIQDGTHFSPRLGGSDFLYVTSKSIGRGVLDLATAGRISADEHAKIYARCDVVKGDLLLTKDGANTGNAALNTVDEPISLLSSVAMLRFDGRRHSAAYFLYQILSRDGQQQITEQVSGNAITRLTLAKIRALRFRVAPLTEQAAIAAILSDIDADIAALETKLTKARQIKQGMMQELLTGRIRLPVGEPTK